MRLGKAARKRCAALVALASLTMGATAHAQDGHIRQVGLFGRWLGGKCCVTPEECQICPPATAPAPTSPSARPADQADRQAQPQSPSQQQAQQPLGQPAAEDLPSLDLAAAFATASASGLTAPNMFGDQFSAGAVTMSSAMTTSTITNGFTFTVADDSFSPGVGTHFHSSTGGDFGNPSGLAEVGGLFGSEEVRGLSEYSLSGLSGSPAVVVFQVSQLGGLFGQSNFVGNIVIEAYAGNNAEDLSDFQAPTIATLGTIDTANLSAGDLVSVDVGTLLATLLANGNTSLGIRLRAEPATTSDEAIVFSGFRIASPVVFFVANPAGGGTVGRTKIADDNSPLPRDRVIFNYDYFNNVPIVPGGWDVGRFSPGFEKTFLDQRASIEVRFPFASTVASSFTQGAESTNTEFGNIMGKLKFLLYQTSNWVVSGGLSVSLPTADDSVVGLANGMDLIRVNNDAYLVAPFMASLYTNQRFFAQSWLAFEFDTNGNPVLAATGPGAMTQVGRLNTQTLMQVDGQIGYWLYDNPEAGRLGVRRLAPFIELHYNTTLGDPDFLQTAQNVFIGGLAGNTDELNLSFGATAQLGDTANMTLGVAAPLKRESDRFFDYQVGFRFNWFYGPTARDFRRASSVSSF